MKIACVDLVDVVFEKYMHPTARKRESVAVFERSKPTRARNDQQAGSFKKHFFVENLCYNCNDMKKCHDIYLYHILAYVKVSLALCTVSSGYIDLGFECHTMYYYSLHDL